MKLKAVGFQLSAVHTPSEDQPGKFRSSDPILQQIYELGGRSVEAACVEKYSQPSTWELTPDGPLVWSQQTAQSAKGVGLANYALEFSAPLTFAPQSMTKIRTPADQLPFSGVCGANITKITSFGRWGANITSVSLYG